MHVQDGDRLLTAESHHSATARAVSFFLCPRHLHRCGELILRLTDNVVVVLAEIADRFAVEFDSYVSGRYRWRKKDGCSHRHVDIIARPLDPRRESHILAPV